MTFWFGWPRGKIKLDYLCGVGWLKLILDAYCLSINIVEKAHSTTLVMYRCVCNQLN